MKLELTEREIEILEARQQQDEYYDEDRICKTIECDECPLHEHFCNMDAIDERRVASNAGMLLALHHETRGE